MDTSYRFTSDAEPTDEQLEELMAAVLVDVKERATAADAKFKAHMAAQLEELLATRKHKQQANENSEA